MRQLLAPSTALLAVLAPVPALADLSALDVWNNWRSYIEDTGYTIDVGGQDEVGSSLILRDIGLVVPDEEVDIRATISSMEFRETGDGRVEITVASDMPFSMSAENELDMTMIIRQSGLMVVASGDPNDITYDLDAQSVSVEFDKFIVEGEAFEPEMRFAMTGLTGQSNVKQGDGWTVAGTSAVEAVTGNLNFEDPESGDAVSMVFSMADLKTDSTSFMSAELDPMDPASLFSDAMDVRAKVSLGDLNVAISVAGDDAFDLTAAAASQELDFSMSGGSLAYETASRGVNYAFSSPQMPLPPINVSIEETGGAFEFPLGLSEEFQDFRMMFYIRNLVTEDFLWSMIDPSGMIPRDPASISVDISGKLKVLADIFDPDAIEDFDDDMPFELDSIDINDVSVSIAGAAIESDGSFFFDNTDLETFDGFPAPTGGVNIDIYGVNGLIDTLVQMGLIPDDQAMGARMMMGAFARPAEGDDHLQSTIEVHSDGSVYANGMQLQ